VGSYTLNLLIRFCKEEKEEKRRINAIETIYNNRKIQNTPNPKNIEIINEFLEL